MSTESISGVYDALITFLKTEARQLHKKADAGEQSAVLRLQANAPAVMVGSEIQRKHALATIAREIGFPNWKAVVDCFDENATGDFAAFLHPKRCHVYWNIWLAHYDEAKKVHADHGGYLLSYASQFLVVEGDYIRSLGLDPLDPRWEAVGRDWHQPKDYSALGVCSGDCESPSACCAAPSRSSVVKRYVEGGRTCPRFVKIVPHLLFMKHISACRTR